ncbi:DUF6795 domain-containing protein [Vibrio penaeicida]|uniref:DUF6795 domain-containing protein n=1 Tax=Vibrio penaeicida TaxID=104609 RepID=UPI000CE9CF44|nr:DUF6795 domain-containing protein [Vibrio penaeicida]
MFKRLLVICLVPYSNVILSDTISLSENPNKLAPPVSGKIFLKGKPLSGITVIREVQTLGKIVDVVKTDETGAFYFRAFHYDFLIPTKDENTLKAIITITAEKGDSKKALWSSEHTGINYLPFMKPAMSTMTCDFSSGVSQIEFQSHSEFENRTQVKSICQFKNNQSPTM